MDIRPIRNDNDHRAAMKEIDRLWGAPADTPEGDKLDVLVTLVDAYEHKRWPVPASTPLDALRYAITDLGHTQKELADLLGSRSRASEILNGKRPLTVEQIRKLSRAWRIPVELLVPDDDSSAAA